MITNEKSPKHFAQKAQPTKLQFYSFLKDPILFRKMFLDPIKTRPSVYSNSHQNNLFDLD